MAQRGNPVVSARVDPDMQAWLDRQAEQEQTDRAEIVRRLLTDGRARREGQVAA